MNNRPLKKIIQKSNAKTVASYVFEPEMAQDLAVA